MLLWIAALAAEQAENVSLSAITPAVLAEECAKNRGLQLDVCTTYILGVSDTLQLDRKTCRAHSDVATLQTVTIARRYINEHPEEWDMHPAVLVTRALVKAFPCRK